MAERLRVLGIDPGSRLTGFGVLDFERDRPVYVASGTVNSMKGEFTDRLKQIFESVREIVVEYAPDVVAVESIFVHHNAGSALKLGHARAAAICATFGYDTEIHEYAPREIKQAIVGTGAATKEQVQHMVMSLLISKEGRLLMPRMRWRRLCVTAFSVGYARVSVRVATRQVRNDRFVAWPNYFQASPRGRD